MSKAKAFFRDLRFVLGLTLVFWAGALSQGYALAQALQVSWGSPRWVGALILGLAGMLILIGLLVLTWTAPTRLKNLVARGGATLARLRPLHLPLMLLLAGIFPLLLLPAYPSPVGELLNTYFWRAFPSWLATVAGAIILQVRNPGQNWWPSLGKSALIYGVAYRIAVFLPDITNYPFTLYWSEGSRYFYASLFFSEKVYGVHANPTILHPTRYWLQSLPFLISGLPLWVHRAWQVGLWVGLNGLAAWAVVRRVFPPRAEGLGKSLESLGWQSGLSKGRVYVMLWAFLFLFQGPIWYHLVVMVALVAWGTDTARFWKTMLVVALASAWAGVSRVNWIPFPAAMAGMLYLLEREKGQTSLWKYLAIPVLWGMVGGVVGWLAQRGYVQWSGNDPDLFGSAFASDLLWYRLFPSATYPLGVVPGVLLVSLPVLALGWVRLRGQWGTARAWQAVHPIRWLGVAGAVGVFALGGLIVSAKIGGGSNLHNMDGYLALLLMVGGYAIFGKIKLEAEVSQMSEARPTPWLVGLVILMPVLFALGVRRAYDYDFLAPPNKVQKALKELQTMVAEATANGGEVLFISERQLLTFGLVDAPLVDPGMPFEKVFMMEMAMANQPKYLGQFETDLRAHRYALIVTVPVQDSVQTEADNFGEENNAWVARINTPLACYYQRKEKFKEVRVEVLEPREGGACPVSAP